MRLRSFDELVWAVLAYGLEVSDWEERRKIERVQD